MKHNVDDLSFELPEGWSLSFVLSAPNDPKETFRSNIVVSTDRMKQNETYQTYVDRQLIELAKGLKRFTLKGRKTVNVCGIDATQLECGWAASQGAVDQWITMVPIGSGVRTVTATALKRKSDEMQIANELLLASMNEGIVVEAQPAPAEPTADPAPAPTPPETT